MKRLQLPKNKLTRLAINIAFIVGWAYVAREIHFQIFQSIQSIDPPFTWWAIQFPEFLYCLYLLIPMGLVTKYMWFGRLKRRPRITRSKED